MRPIVYDFAMTMDGFICRNDGSVTGFLEEGSHVSDYLDRLHNYDTVLMGRKTYEFGYHFGLNPGERAYAHMEHYIFSDSLNLESDQVNIVGRDQMGIVRRLKEAQGRDIYLCGGGEFACSLLELQLIDQLVIKLNPIVLGSGIRPFGDSTQSVNLVLLQSKTYDNGVVLLQYAVDYKR